MTKNCFSLFQRGFHFFGVTLMELVIALAILGVGLVAILNMINAGTRNTDKLRQEVIAINLAREGVEVVYNIRNTNRMRRAGQKDKCRLKRNPFDTETDDICGNDAWLTTGHYLVRPVLTGGQVYFSLIGAGTTSGLDLSFFHQGIDDRYTLCYGKTPTMHISGWYHCPGQMTTRSEGRFFRDIEGLGLYKKDVDIPGGQQMICPQGNAIDPNSGVFCGGPEPKEYRFCSKVQYVKNVVGDVTLCAAMTNFVE